MVRTSPNICDSERAGAPWMGARDSGFQAAALRVLDKQQRADQHHADQPQRDKTGPPTRSGPAERRNRPDQAGDDQAQAGADGDAQIVKPGGQGPLAGMKHVAEHGDGGRRECRFADADEKPRCTQLPEVLGQPAGRRTRAPHKQAERDQPGTMPAVGDGPQKQTGDRVDHGKGIAGQHGDLQRSEAQLLANRHLQAGDELPVYEVHDIQQREERQQPPGIAR